MSWELDLCTKVLQATACSEVFLLTSCRRAQQMAETDGDELEAVGVTCCSCPCKHAVAWSWPTGQCNSVKFTSQSSVHSHTACYAAASTQCKSYSALGSTQLTPLRRMLMCAQVKKYFNTAGFEVRSME